MYFYIHYMTIFLSTPHQSASLRQGGHRPSNALAFDYNTSYVDISPQGKAYKKHFRTSPARYNDPSEHTTSSDAPDCRAFSMAKPTASLGVLKFTASKPAPLKRSASFSPASALDESGVRVMKLFAFVYNLFSMASIFLSLKIPRI